MIERVRLWLRRYLAAGSFRRAVATVATGSGAAMALTYLAQPVLTRLYTQAAFGTLDVLVSVVVLLIPLATLRFDPAVLLPDDERDAASVVALALTLACGAAVFFSGAILAVRPWLSQWGYGTISNWLFLLPPALLAVLSDKLARYWLTRRKQFSLLSVGRAGRAAVAQGSRILFAVFLTVGAGGLLGGYLLGLIAAALFYVIMIALRDGLQLFYRAFRWSRLRRVARRYRRFPFFTMPSVLLNTLASRLPFLLLLFFFNEATVGRYGRASLALAAPLGLLGQSVGNVFFAHSAEAAREGALRPLAHRVHARLAEVSLFPTLALMLAGPDVFAVVLGKSWRLAGEYLRFIGPWIMLSSIVSPLTVLFDVLERQRLDLMMSAVLFVLQTTALAAGGMTGNVHTALLALGVAGVAGRLLHGAALLRISRVPVQLGLRPYGRAVRISVPFLLPVALVTWLDVSPIWTTGVVLLCGAGFAWRLLPKLIETPHQNEQ
jgi:O-antigen/teichoic acid export membrane protein